MENKNGHLRFSSPLLKKESILIAGGSPEQVEPAVKLFCEAASLSGLHVACRHNEPAFPGAAAPVVELCLSPTPLTCTGVLVPDAVIVLSSGGMEELLASRLFDRLPFSARVILDAGLGRPRTSAEIYHLPFRSITDERGAVPAALMVYLALSGIFPVEAFEAMLGGAAGGVADLSEDLTAVIHTVMAFPERG